MNCCCRLSGCAALLIALALALPAGAQDTPQAGPIAKLLPLRVSGARLSTDEVRTLTDALVAKLKRYPRIEVLPAPDQDAMDMVVDAGCADLDADCLATIGKSAGAEKVMMIEVTEKDGRKDVQLRYVDTTSREALVPQPTSVTRDKVAEALATSIEKVLGFEPTAPVAPVRVEILSIPDGAEVYVDRGFVGKTPIAIELKPEAYGIRVAKHGYNEALLMLSVNGPEPLSQTFTLTRVGDAGPTEPPVQEPPPESTVSETPWYATWWFWTAVGGAVVVAGTTAYLLSRDDPGSGGSGAAGFAVNPALAPNDVLIFGIR